MNKKITLIAALLPILSSCMGGKSNPLEKALKDFSSGIKVDVVGAEDYYGSVTNYVMTNTSKSKEFSMIMYNNEQKEEKLLREYFCAQDDEYVYSTRLNIANKYNYYQIYNPANGDFFTWEDGFDNVFTLLNAEDFEKVESNKYSLKKDALSTYNDYFSCLFYGNPGLDFSVITLTIDGKDLLFKGAAGWQESLNYSYNFTASVSSKGGETSMDYRDLPLEEVNDPRFEQLLDAIKQNNYTATIVNEDDMDDRETSYYYCNPDKLYYVTPTYESGFYVDEFDMVQEVVEEAGEYYKVGAPMEININRFMPSFDISRATFDSIDEHTLKFKKGIEGDMGVFTVLETWTETLDNLTIKEESNNIVITNIHEDNKTTITFSDIGTTNVGFEINNVNDAKIVDGWDKLLDSESYNYLVSIAGLEVIEKLPIPTSYHGHEWYQLSEENYYGFLASQARFTIETDIEKYHEQLTQAGFTLSSEKGLNDGCLATIETTLDSVLTTIAVEYLEFEGLFCILVYDAALLLE